MGARLQIGDVAIAVGVVECAAAAVRARQQSANAACTCQRAAQIIAARVAYRGTVVGVPLLDDPLAVINVVDATV